MSSGFLALLAVAVATAPDGRSPENVRMAVPRPDLVARVMRGELKDAHVVWWGFDPVDSTRFVRAAITSGVSRLVFDRMSSPWIVSEQVDFVSDQEVEFAEGTVLEARRGSFRGKWTYLACLRGLKNVTLRGRKSRFMMHKEDYQNPPYERSEHRHALAICGCRNVVVEGIEFSSSGGDGIYVCDNGRSADCSSDVVIRDCVCTNNTRQGISVISAQNLLIERCALTGTKGMPPEAGIDFEPNRTEERLQNCVLRDCVLAGNNGCGIELFLGQLDASSPPVSIRIENCRSGGNRCGLSLGSPFKPTVPRGTLSVTGCEFREERGAAVSFWRKLREGVDVTLTNCRFVNCRAGKDQESLPDVELVSAKLGEGPVDGLTFGGCEIHQTVGRDWIRRRGNVMPNGPVQAIVGDVVVTSPAGTRRITLDEIWRKSYFPKELQEPIPPFRSFDPLQVDVHDEYPGVSRRLSAIRFRKSVGYRFYAERAGRVAFSGRLCRIGSSDRPGKPLRVLDLDGKVVAELPLPGEDGGRFVFEAPAKGFYLLKVVVGENAFVLESATVPIAAEASDRMLSVLAFEGEAWFRTKPSDAWAFTVAGEGSERVGVRLFNPNEGKAWERPSVGGWELFKADKDAPDGVWRVEFGCPQEGAFEDYGFALLGIQPELFLSEGRYW